MKRVKPHLDSNFTFKLNRDTMEVVKNLVGSRSMNEWMNDAVLRKLAINAKDYANYSDKDIEAIHRMGVERLEA